MQKNIWNQIKNLSMLLSVTIIVAVFNFDRARAGVLPEEQLAEAQNQIQSAGYHEWVWMVNVCSDCELYILPLHEELTSARVIEFMTALSLHKEELQKIYGVSGEEYNLLAHMAVGILGRESLFFKSTRYKIKETFPWAVRLLKVIQIFLSGQNKAPSPNSRGPTQIKIVPDEVAWRYGITVDNLYVPENAAIATMGFLIEALDELKRRRASARLYFVAPATYVDYLPYIYFGKTRSIMNRTATPDNNLYVQEMKKYMTWVRLYERSTSPAVRIKPAE